MDAIEKSNTPISIIEGAEERVVGLFDRNSQKHFHAVASNTMIALQRGG